MYVLIHILIINKPCEPFRILCVYIKEVMMMIKTVQQFYSIQWQISDRPSRIQATSSYPHTDFNLIRQRVKENKIFSCPSLAKIKL